MSSFIITSVIKNPFLDVHFDKNVYGALRKELNDLRLSVRLNSIDHGSSYDEYDLGEVYNLRMAVLFYVINKISFNGLWRECSNGVFNTPFGDRQLTALPVMTKNALKAYKNTLFHCRGYNDTFDEISELDNGSTIIYMDPPYMLTSPTSFTKYTAKAWDQHDDTAVGMAHAEFCEDRFLCISSQSGTPRVKKLYGEGSEYMELRVTNSVGGKNADRAPRVDYLIFPKWVLE